MERLQLLAREALEELRSLILELRPPDLDRDGLCGALRKHVEVLRQIHAVEIDLDFDATVSAGGDGRRDREILRIAQEALQNAMRHAGAGHVDVRLKAPNGRLSLEIADDGVGFEPADPALRSKRLGLTSMEERAARLGATLAIDSERDAGTTVRLELELA
jgi:signal transduction histidine kinase